MSVNILSDLARWAEVANVPATDGDGNVIEGMYETRPEAYGYIVIGSMAIGMGELNEKTAEEYLARLMVIEAVYGPTLYAKGDGGKLVGVPVTMDALRPYFGTRTNVFPKESTASFTRRMGKALMTEMEYKVRRQQREAEEAVNAAAEVPSVDVDA
jgi:hypothetical protein